MAFGGPGIPTSVVHLANLFPNNCFLVMTTITGSTTLSFSILSIFDILWSRYNIGFRSLFGWYTVVIIVSAISAFILWPDTTYHADDFVTENDARYDALNQDNPPTEQHFVTSLVEHEHLIEQPLDATLRVNEDHRLDRHGSYLLSRQAMESGNATALANISLKDLPFRSQVSNGCYWRIAILFVAFSFFANFYVASVTVEVSQEYG